MGEAKHRKLQGALNQRDYAGFPEMARQHAGTFRNSFRKNKALSGIPPAD